MINKIDVILKVKVIENIMKKTYGYLCYAYLYSPFIELFIMGYAYMRVPIVPLVWTVQ